MSESNGNGVAVMERVEQSTAVTTQPPQEKKATLIVINTGPNACLLDTALFEQMQRLAKIFGSATLLPDHLLGRKKGNDFEYFPREQVIGNCFLIINQAFRWEFDPFAVMAETYVVGGKLGFQGKLVAAVVNSRAKIKSSLDFSFNGAKGDALEVTVSATLIGEETPRTVTLTVGQGKTSNQMWTKDPEQKLVYSGAIKWARRHTPQVILGVLTDDDLDRMNDRTSTITDHRPKRISDLTATAEKQTESSVEQPAKESKPVQTLSDCMAFMDDLVMNKESGVTFLELRDGIYSYAMPDKFILYFGEGSKTDDSVDTKDGDCRDQVQATVEKHSKKR